MWHTRGRMLFSWMVSVDAQHMTTRMPERGRAGWWTVCWIKLSVSQAHTLALKLVGGQCVEQSSLSHTHSRSRSRSLTRTLSLTSSDLVFVAHRRKVK